MVTSIRHKLFDKVFAVEAEDMKAILRTDYARKFQTATTDQVPATDWRAKWLSHCDGQGSREAPNNAGLDKWFRGRLRTTRREQVDTLRTRGGLFVLYPRLAYAW